MAFSSPIRFVWKIESALSRGGNGTGFWNFNRFGALFPMMQTTLPSVTASVRKLLVVFTAPTQLGQSIVVQILLWMMACFVCWNRAS